MSHLNFSCFLIVHRVRRHSMEKTALSLSPPNTAAFETKPKQRHCRSTPEKQHVTTKVWIFQDSSGIVTASARMSECSTEHAPILIQCPANLEPPLHIGIWGFCIPPKEFISLFWLPHTSWLTIYIQNWFLNVCFNSIKKIIFNLKNNYPLLLSCKPHNAV